MIRKHNLLFAILFCVSLSAFCGVYDDINGVWLDGDSIQSSSLFLKQKEYSWGVGIDLPGNLGLMFDIDDHGEGYFKVNYFKGKVLKVEKSDYGNGYSIYCYDDYYGEINFKINFITDDKCEFDRLEEYGSGYTMIRVSGPVKKICGTAVTIKDNVPLYNANKNEISEYYSKNKSQIATLKTSSEVQIIDKTDAPDKKNGEKYCWYKVRCLGYPDGWVYGEDLKILKLEK